MLAILVDPEQRALVLVVSQRCSVLFLSTFVCGVLLAMVYLFWGSRFSAPLLPYLVGSSHSGWHWSVLATKVLAHFAFTAS